MPKEAEFFNAASAAKGGAFTATKTTESGSRSGSTSSAKYRVSSRPSGLEALDTASHSPETRLSATNVSLMLLRMNKSSASRLSLSDPSGSEASASSATAKPKNGRYAITTEALTPPTKGPGTPKLPQKLRQHVNRLRSQFASGSASGSSRTLAIGGRSSSPTPSPHKVPRSSLSTKSIGSRRFSYAAAAALQYSRKPNQLHQLQAAKEGEKQVEPVAGAPTSSPQDSEPTSVNAGTFQDLLRPLQSSLSCAGLRSGWSSDEDDEAEQLFRQSERENSRMLRVCCSIDNLMVSIGDHAQEQKQTEAIVRGASRDLVKLFQFALKQVSSVIFDKAEDQTSNNSPRVEAGRAIAVKIAGKEAQYAMEFILEINERIGRLYEFSRSVFVCEVDELRQRIKELEDELAAATLKNELLQNEMRDLRDFHEQNNASGVDPFAVGSTGDRHPELDDHDDVAISALAFPDIPDANTDAGECSALKQQCQELLRLLEMAKQEIRLSHHERDVQKARVVEISSALFHESELGHLRNQLQSEKKRVRVLERENLTLRESQQDQVLKVQALETLQAASSAAASTSTNSSCVARHSAANRPSSDTASTATNGTVPAEQSTVRLNGLDEEPSAMQTSELTIETRDNQYNFTNTELGLPQEGSHGATMNWFSRIVNPPQPANVRKTRKKQIKAKSEKQSLVGLSKFLASLLMTDKQLATAKEESKVRRQRSVPTLIPPVGTLTAKRSAEARSGNGKKRRLRPDTSTSVSSNGGEPEDNPEQVITCCVQLIWAFYQRFLLAVEAQNLLCTRGVGGDPTLGSGAGSSAGSPAVEPVSLSLIIFHFFFERCSRELDAARELEQFVRCVHDVRGASYTLELFCQFLEENCSRQELCFFLWVCQAMNDVKLGIPYDNPLPSGYGIKVDVGIHHEGPAPQFLCFLKATFLARTIFRLLHFKVLCRPPAVGSGRRRGKAKKSPRKQSSSKVVSVVSLVASTSPASSPKRKPKTRLGELAAAQSPKADSKLPTTNNGESVQEGQTSVPLHVAAQTALREVIENNLGEPITLETFNNLLLKFAVVPSSEELTARLGPFYQPTGDERKIPTDVFLALLMETYKLQLQWQRDQLRALFIHLNHQEELQQRTAEKLAKEEAANTKGDRRKVSEEDKKQRKPRMKRRKSRDGAAETSGSKYLRGLSRSVLRELLLQSGIAEDSDMAQIDIDWLFAELLKKAGGVAADITFDTVYDMLEKMRWLDSTRLRVDSLVQVANVTSMNKASSTTGSRPGVNVSSKSRAPSVVVPSSIVCAIRDEWRVYARHSLALCNNDPNAFIRRHTQRLLHYVDEKLARLVNDSESSDTTNVGGEAIRCIREFLAFAWRVAGKRSSENGLPSIRQTCFTEVFLVSQALRATADSMPGYSGQFVAIEDKAVESQSAEGNPRILQRQTSSQLLVTQDALQCFYDTSRMDLKRFIKDKGSNVPGLDGSVAGQLQELESVLALYAAHIAHLFQRFSEARFNSTPQVSLHRWRSMVFELELVLPRYMPFPKLQLLFESVAEPHLRSESSTPTIAASLDQELGVGKTQFSELFVLIAFKRHRVAAAQKLEKALLTTTKKPRGSQGDTKYALFEAVELADRPARIMAQFCREILAPRAFNSHGNDNALVERNFAAKLSCPLVSRALLEHRSFLRTVFFYYAKQDEVAADERAALEEQALIREIQENGGQVNGTKEPPTESSPADVSAALLQPDPGSDFQLEKTKRSSMSFGEFQTFLTAFKLLDTPEDAVGGSRSERKIALADAQHVFSSAMSLDNDDTLQLEFDEFAAAVVALAVHLNPSPFTLWHQKLDTFAMRLRRIWASQNEGTCSG
ncbi:hypothetical protein PF004_g7769 [Phytophthora fragariae]|uniref:Uncharacterized protein n=1 Tax=Phytophthora fragariae TaxID=53985 RepID=A0A6G0P8R0_9STRA|nr:hypothetical protein PF003_g30636 [Phytophthora fragariae]KAE9239830.1 hypothetical protein PF004_g7769 [Phytophthora fragariae]